MQGWFSLVVTIRVILWQWPPSPEPLTPAWCEGHQPVMWRGRALHGAVLQAQWGGWADESPCVICGINCHNNTWTPQQQQHRGNNRGSNNSTPHSDMKVRSIVCKLHNRESISSSSHEKGSAELVCSAVWCLVLMVTLHYCGLSIELKNTLLCTYS